MSVWVLVALVWVVVVPLVVVTGALLLSHLPRLRERSGRALAEVIPLARAAPTRELERAESGQL